MADDKLYTPPDFDPQLKRCAAEIKDVMKKYDVGGFLALASPTHAEFQIVLEEPTWSCLSYEGGGNWRFKAKVKTGSQEDRDKAEATIHLLDAVAYCSVQAMSAAQGLLSTIKKHLPYDSKPRKTDYEG